MPNPFGGNNTGPLKPGQYRPVTDTGGGNTYYRPPQNNYAQQQEAARRAELDRLARQNAQQIAEARRRDYLAQIKAAQDQAAQRARQRAQQQAAEFRARQEALDAQVYNQFYRPEGEDKSGGYPGVPSWNFRGEYPGLKNMRGPIGTGIANLAQEALNVDEQYYRDAQLYGGPGGQLSGIAQAQPPVSYYPTMNFLNSITTPRNQLETSLPDMRYQWDLEQWEKPRDYFQWFYHGDQTKPELMNYQAEREQYWPGNEPWGGVANQETTYPTYDYGDDYKYPTYEPYNYPEPAKSWYENMLQWNIK